MRTFEQIFRRENISAGFIEGDSFHRYDRADMKQRLASAIERGDHVFSHFGPEANLFAELEGLFRTMGSAVMAASANTCTMSRRRRATSSSRHLHRVGGPPQRHRLVVLRRTARRGRDR